MTLVDANLLLYAWHRGAPEHRSAKRWMEQLIAGDEWIGFAWLTLWAFVRISTNPRLYARPLEAKEAFDIVRKLIALPRVSVVEPGPRHLEILETLVREHRAAGPLLTDAALAALAIEHGAVLASTDQDFSRFAGLRWLNPLRPA